MNEVLDLSKDSRYQEQIVEYKFLSELMISLAYLGKKLEILRVHSDSFGYDLILKVDDKMKYVQLKSRAKSGRNQYWDVHKSLLLNNDGIVLVIYYTLEGGYLNLEYNYLDFEKYTLALQDKPRHKDNDLKYCLVRAKYLIKADSINDISKLFL